MKEATYETVITTRQTVLERVKEQLEQGIYEGNKNAFDLRLLSLMTDKELEKWFNETHYGKYSKFTIKIPTMFEVSNSGSKEPKGAPISNKDQ